MAKESFLNLPAGMSDRQTNAIEIEALNASDGDKPYSGQHENITAGESSVIKTVNSIITGAVNESASDIHIEPGEEWLQVRYRIDGMLREVTVLPKKAGPPLVSRLKLLSSLDIAERRKPQDGRFNIKYSNKTVNLRVSTLPNIFGEKVVIRLFDKSSNLLKISQLGMDEKNYRKFNRILRYSGGMLLATGPTGCGKTTTLYAVLNEINSPEKNIVTIEDPVEYVLPGISQTQVNSKAGLTFALGLRSILRQDPDVIMVGEIRDAETAEIAVRSATTGHLVLSTLHTNDAAGALTRLIDMGIEPFMVASCVLGVVAQRLIRLICPKCKKSFQPNSKQLLHLNMPDENIPVILHHGEGCRFCSFTGYRGRTGIYEVMPVNRKMREMINKKSSADLIREQAVRDGMITLKEAGINKALKGLTTIEEVMRVAYTE